MEVPLKTSNVEDAWFLEILISGDWIIKNKRLLIRGGLTEVEMDMVTFGRIEWQVPLVTPYTYVI